jgi:hypothetical protein
MAAFLRLLIMLAVPTFALVAARNALPVIRRLPATKPLSRYRFGVPDVRFAPRDLGM